MAHSFGGLGPWLADPGVFGLPISWWVSDLLTLKQPGNKVGDREVLDSQDLPQGHELNNLRLLTHAQFLKFTPYVSSTRLGPNL